MFLIFFSTKNVEKCENHTNRYKSTPSVGRASPPPHGFPLLPACPPLCCGHHYVKPLRGAIKEKSGILALKCTS